MNRKLAELRFLLMETEDDYDTMPHFGVLDWHSRYWELHEKCAELIEEAESINGVESTNDPNNTEESQ